MGGEIQYRHRQGSTARALDASGILCDGFRFRGYANDGNVNTDTQSQPGGTLLYYRAAFVYRRRVVACSGMWYGLIVAVLPPITQSANAGHNAARNDGYGACFGFWFHVGRYAVETEPYNSGYDDSPATFGCALA